MHQTQFRKRCDSSEDGSEEERPRKSRRTAARDAAFKLDELARHLYECEGWPDKDLSTELATFQRGDALDNPICVDDYAWSSGRSHGSGRITPESEEGNTSCEAIDTQAQRDDRGMSVDIALERSQTLSDHVPSNSLDLQLARSENYVPSPSISPDPCSIRQDRILWPSDAVLAPSPSISPEPSNGVRNTQAKDDLQWSQRPKQLIVEVPLLPESEKSKYCRPVPRSSTTNEPTSRHSVFRALLSRESTVMSESPFFIPLGEEDLWRDYDAEDAHEEEMVEHYLVHNETHPDAQPHLTKLPLDAYVGKHTLEWHARIDPRSLPFRKAIISIETGDRDYLVDGGAAAATDMFERLGIPVPPDLGRRIERRNGKKTRK